MKKPLLNLQERQFYNEDNFTGALLRLFIARKHLERQVYKDYGCVGVWFLRRMTLIKTTYKERNELNK